MNEDRPLPRRLDQALKRIAEGETRVATAAHPDCVCGKERSDDDPDKWMKGRYYGLRDCPQHRPEKFR